VAGDADSALVVKTLVGGIALCNGCIALRVGIAASGHDPLAEKSAMRAIAAATPEAAEADALEAELVDELPGDPRR
jgi:hypothetical protein